MTRSDQLALDVLCLVHVHVNERGEAPSVRQLAAWLRTRSWTSVQRQVRRLIRHGLLCRAEPSGVLRPVQTPWRRPARRVCSVPRGPRAQHDRRVQSGPTRSRQRRGYGPGSAAEVDAIAIERALDGDPFRALGIAEKVAAVRIGARRGWNDREIAERIKVTPRHVLRIRRLNGIRCGVPIGTNQHSARHGTWGLIA
ncbi:LexA family protein [Micromonospora arborensis]|uniref:LexA family protein n=1 Tax=Micromonospora arborensis TaxID=2116518 RepID=UPI003724A259